MNNELIAQRPLALSKKVITFSIAGQYFGLPVMAVTDVVVAQPVTPVPRAPEAMRGIMNLRGQIVPVIDTAILLSLDKITLTSCKHIIMRYRNESYSYLVDSIRDVKDLSNSLPESNLTGWNANWKGLVGAVYRLADQLVTILNPEQLLYAVGVH